MKIPIVLLHARVTATGIPVHELEAIRDGLRVYLDSVADTWGLRVKRRILSRENMRKMFAVYQERQKVSDDQVRTRRREKRKQQKQQKT